jgi:hypothetical protein
MMPAFIDALHRRDTAWLTRLKKLLFGAAAIGAIIAGTLPFGINKSIITFAFPKEVSDLPIIYIIFCSYFAFAFAFVALLAPLYIGAHRAVFYGILNFAFTLAGVAVGALLCMRFGASAMMGSLAVMMTICAIFLLAAISLVIDSHLDTSNNRIFGKGLRKRCG